MRSLKSKVDRFLSPHTAPQCFIVLGLGAFPIMVVAAVNAWDYGFYALVLFVYVLLAPLWIPLIIDPPEKKETLAYKANHLLERALHLTH